MATIKYPTYMMFYHISEMVHSDIVAKMQPKQKDIDDYVVPKVT